MTRKQLWGTIAAIVAVLGIITFAVMVEIHTVHGNEIAILETWSGGVDETFLAIESSVRHVSYYLECLFYRSYG